MKPPFMKPPREGDPKMETAKIPRNHFRCYNCRNVFAQRDGEWFHWDSMQVHLCNSCNKKTESRPERARSGKGT